MKSAGGTLHRARVGERLVNAHVISQAQVDSALLLQETRGCRLGGILVDMKVVTESLLLECLSHQHGVPVADVVNEEASSAVLRLIPGELARKHGVLPVRKENARLVLAMVDPSNTAVVDELTFVVGMHILPCVALERDIRAAIDRRYPRETASLPHDGAHRTYDVRNTSMPGCWTREATDIGGVGHQEFDELHAYATDVAAVMAHNDVQAVTEREEHGHEDKAPVVQFVDRILASAADAGASDIHIEPFETNARIRFRIDGALRTIMDVPKHVHRAMTARLKIMARLDIAERRLPQDGRIHVPLSTRRLCDIRLSLLPCLYGEKAVLRVLDRESLGWRLEHLGFDEDGLLRVTSALHAPHGMILVCGPTGSGKTTTLYSALQSLNAAAMNIVTVEDPVEYQLAGINQLQVKEDIGLTFAVGLRSFLRQDPDVMMVGEVRDRETAQIAVQAALTGHRVLSTLHTTDAPQAITRLLDMGVEPFLVSSALSLVIAQRLVRTICSQCREPEAVRPLQLQALGFSAEESHALRAVRGAGCRRCHGTGYRGRMALFEVLSLSEELHEKILRRASGHELKACALRSDFSSLRKSGLRAIREGLTTVEEVSAATTDDVRG